MSEARKREGGAANVQRASCIVPVGAAVWFRGAAVLAAVFIERGSLVSWRGISGGTSV